MNIRLAVRVYIGRVLKYEELITIENDQVPDLMPALAQKHIEALARSPGMIEIEFLDEPNEQERFFRIGSDPAGMVLPLLLAVPPPEIH